MRPIVCWGSGQNAVVILWIALGFHQGLPAAIGTACKIGVFGSVSVEGFYGGFGERGRFVNRAVGVLDNFFGMAERPGCIGAICGMAGVRGRGCVPLQDRQRQRAVVDFSGEAAVALAA